jgi:hypothetical protein
VVFFFFLGLFLLPHIHDGMIKAADNAQSTTGGFNATRTHPTAYHLILRWRVLN